VISKIIDDFKKSVVFKKNDEMDLFRALAISIEKHSAATFIDETHGGNVCNVSFTSITGKNETCEIADLLIVSESSLGDLRATFWQAKKQAVSKWLNVTHEGNQVDFKGQFNQWDLLSRRPSITGVAGFNPPSDLLSSFLSPSIGTFGVFYEKGTEIEIAHSIAEFISCPTPAAKHPTLSINGFLDKYHCHIDETITKTDFISFLDALLNFEIGALLQRDEGAHQWLIKYVKSKLLQKNPQKPVPDSFESFIDRNAKVVDMDPTKIDGVSILVLGNNAGK
jgi:hypothetical protein